MKSFPTLFTLFGSGFEILGNLPVHFSMISIGYRALHPVKFLAFVQELDIIGLFAFVDRNPPTILADKIA